MRKSAKQKKNAGNRHSAAFHFYKTAAENLVLAYLDFTSWWRGLLKVVQEEIAFRIKHAVQGIVFLTAALAFAFAAIQVLLLGLFFLVRELTASTGLAVLSISVLGFFLAAICFFVMAGQFRKLVYGLNSRDSRKKQKA